MAEPFDPKAFLAEPTPPPVAFDPKAFLAEPSGPPRPPTSGARTYAEDPATAAAMDAAEKVRAGPQPSEIEQRITADTLRNLLAARGNSLTERATDWVVPGIKNALGGAAAVGKGLFAKEGTLGEHWSAGVNAEKQYRGTNRENTAGPVGYAADTAGALFSIGKPGGGFAGAAPSSAVAQGAPVVQGTSRVAQTLPGAVKSGATQGAISGAAENSQDLASAVQGGVKGGVTGGVVGAGSQMVTGLVAKALQDRLARAAAAERAGQRGPTPDQYFKDAGAKFKELDNAGILYDQGQARRLGGMLPQVLKDANYTKTSAPELEGALKSVYEAGAKGAAPLTFTELQAIRGKVSAAAQANPANVNLRRIAGHVTGMIDDFVDKTQPAINQTGANVGKLWGEAREMWRTGILGDTITDIEKIAANNAAVRSTSAEDIARKAVVQQANKDIKAGLPSLPPAAEAARQAAIDGTRMQRAANSVAEGSKNWQVNAAAGAGLGSVLGTMTGLPVGITGPAAGLLGAAAGKGLGSAAKSYANSQAQNNMDTLVRAIMTGSAEKPQVWDMPRDLLASLMARRAVQSGAVQGALPGGEYVIDELTKNR